MRPSSLSRIRSLLLLVLFAIVPAACGEDTTAPEEADDSLSMSDLVGSWIATSHVFTNQANTSETFDLVGAGGELRATVLTGGRVRTWVTLGDFSDEWDSGITIVGDEITVTPVESTRPSRRWTVSLQENGWTMTSTDGEWDFTLAGADPVPANERVVWVVNN